MPERIEAQEPGIRHYGAAPGVGVADYDRLPTGTQTRSIAFKAVDGSSSRGVLHARGGEKTVICISHPRADVSQHYTIPALLEAGFAVYSHQCRGLNNDVDCVHEELLLDLAGGFHHLRSELGFGRMVLLGTSGGGSLFAFYQQQASKPPAQRLTSTPAGAPTLLDRIEMPRADGVILLGVHPGEGRFMLDVIDPSVVDENDPLAVDPSLDMYDPNNGFAEPPQRSHYDAQFLERYREAQRARIARLDARAKALIAGQERYKGLIAAPGFEDLPQSERNYQARRAVVGHYMIIYRTEANPAYCDLALHSWKSTRQVGSIVGKRPDLLNYSPGGFARYITPRAWLSTWSGLSSKAALLSTLSDNRAPLLIVSYTADNGCFPDQNRDQLAACPAEDKELAFADADHYGLPLSGRQQAIALLVDWLKARF
jgi:hypothetical protein